MAIVRMRIDPSKPGGYVDWAKFDATTEEEIAQQIAEDEAEALREAAERLQSIRHRLGLSQEELAERIHVSVTSIRNWEQGKRYPTGAARALYRILDKQPEAALSALERRTSLPKPRRYSSV
jgi:putative transcriptional regulator